MSDRLTTLALLWTLERRDGVTIGLTDHDRDLRIEGRTYRAAPGMTPAAIERSDGLDAAITQASGALTHATVTERDLIAGRWDGARVTVAVVDWDEGGTPIVLSGGTIGEIEIDERGFTAQLRGPAAMLDRAVTEETSAECRAMLGDRRCRVPMAGRRRIVRVVEASGAALTVDAPEPAADAYGNGRLRWLSGEGCGLASEIDRSAGAVLTLRMPPPFTVAPGTLVELIEGCDKTVATCAARFANVANFRGEPYLPGVDLLTRYPGA
ncbi:DUF2163 domain-containing protein [Sphingomonas sp. IC-11]|uniref:DUF2163 domain-containing protein n=1 Tax=Sphingomonas sp. IC-11 TaxID=2898528 RepID=UPI001E313FF3|nr:DUF2163 domain-containing protein [Sphingomonas sp. IC-11]MCD2317650.1 DUF2163 domain-containing protein [Sphingomonas sp. IC-11]